MVAQANSDKIIFETIKERLANQQQSIGRIDTKAAVILSFSGAILAGLVNSTWFLGLGVGYRLCVLLAFGLSTFMALLAILTRKFRQDPDPSSLVALYGGLSEKATRGQLIANYADCYKENSKAVGLKVIFLKISLALLTASVFILATTVFFSQHSIKMEDKGVSNGQRR